MAELYFDMLCESSNKSIVKVIFLDVTSFAAVGGHTCTSIRVTEKAVIKLPASEILGVKAEEKGMTKRAVLTMKNEQQFVFDYGILSVKKLVATTESVVGD